MIVGIVLAAGSSRRMGTAKALLPLDGTNLLQHAVSGLTAGGCDEVVVVTSATRDGDRIAAASRAAGAQVVVNPLDPSEQIDSLRSGLRVLGSSAEAVIVVPVDSPGARPHVVGALIAGFRRTSAPVVLPVSAGERGHPALFAREAFPAFDAPGLSEGARSVIRMFEPEVMEVEVGEPRVLLDLDTPEEYRRFREESDERG